MIKRTFKRKPGHESWPGSQAVPTVTESTTTAAPPAPPGLSAEPSARATLTPSNPGQAHPRASSSVGKLLRPTAHVITFPALSPSAKMLGADSWAVLPLSRRHPCTPPQTFRKHQEKRERQRPTRYQEQLQLPKSYIARELENKKKRKRKCSLKRNSLRITVWSIRARTQSPHHEQVLRAVRRRKRLRKPINPPWLEMRQQMLAASSLIQTTSIYLNRRVWNLFKPKCSPPSVHTQFSEKAHAFNSHYMQNASTGQNGWCS